VILEFELRVSCLLSRCSSACAMLQPCLLHAKRKVVEAKSRRQTYFLREKSLILFRPVMCRQSHLIQVVVKQDGVSLGSAEQLCLGGWKL
jgi:hypothetical protein